MNTEKVSYSAAGSFMPCLKRILWQLKRYVSLPSWNLNYFNGSLSKIDINFYLSEQSRSWNLCSFQHYYRHYRQGISLSNLANWVTEFFEVVPISMMSEGHFKRLAHSEKTMVVTWPTTWSHHGHKKFFSPFSKD